MPRKNGNKGKLTPSQQATAEAYEYVENLKAMTLGSKPRRDPLMSSSSKKDLVDTPPTQEEIIDVQKSFRDHQEKERTKSSSKNVKDSKPNTKKTDTTSESEDHASSVDGSDIPLDDSPDRSDGNSDALPSSNSTSLEEDDEEQEHDANMEHSDEDEDCTPGNADDDSSSYDPSHSRKIKLSSIYKASDYKPSPDDIEDYSAISSDGVVDSSDVSSESSERDQLSMDSDDPDFLTSEDSELDAIINPSKPGEAILKAGKRTGEAFYTDLNLTSRQIAKQVVDLIRTKESGQSELSCRLASKQRQQKNRYKNLFSALFSTLSTIFYSRVEKLCAKNFSTMLNDCLLSTNNGNDFHANYELLCHSEGISLYQMSEKQQYLFADKAAWLVELHAQIHTLLMNRLPECIAKDFIDKMLVPGILQYYDNSTGPQTKFPCPILGSSYRVDCIVIFLEEQGKETALDINFNASVILNTIFELFHLSERITRLFASQFIRLSTELYDSKILKLREFMHNMNKSANQPRSEDIKTFREMRTKLLKQKRESLKNWDQLDHAGFLSSEYERFHLLLTRVYAIIPQANNKKSQNFV